MTMLRSATPRISSSAFTSNTFCVGLNASLFWKIRLADCSTPIALSFAQLA